MRFTPFIIRVVVAVCGVFIISSIANEVPWLTWTRNPVAIPMTVTATDIYAAPGTSVDVSLAEGKVSQFGLDCDLTSTNSPALVANLKIRGEYQLTVVASNLTSLNLQLSFRSNWTPISRRGRSAQPKVYHLMVDRSPNTTGEIPVFNNGGCTAFYSNTWTIELTERLPSNWRLEDGSDSPESAPGDGVWARIGPGKSLETNRASIDWSVSLGRLMDGNAAGRLSIREMGLSREIYTPTNIFYTAASEVVRDQVDLITKELGSPVLRQVKAYQTFVNIVDLTNRTEMRFYLTNHVGTATNSLGHYTSFSDDPFVTWIVLNPEATTTNKLNIIEERNGVNRTNQLVCNPTSTNSTWTLKYGVANEERVETRGVIFEAGPPTMRTEVVDVRYTGGATPTYRATEKYRLFSWGFELVELRVDPDNNGATANDLITLFTYYENAGEPTAFGKLKSIVYPDGHWEKRTYYTSWGDYEIPGALHRVYTPWGNGPADPELASESDSHYQQYTYAIETGSVFTVATFAPGGQYRQQLSIKYLSAAGVEVSEDLTMKGETGGSATRVGYCSHAPDELWGFGYYGNEFYKRNTGRQMEQNYFHGGTYNSTSRTFTPSGGNIWAGPDWRRSTLFTGQELSNLGVNGIQVSSVEGEALFSELGVTYLFPYRSWKESHIYQKGSLAQKETHVFTGVDGGGEPIFDLVSKLIYQNDSLGHATNIIWVDGATNTISRTIYSANYGGTNGIDGNLKQWEMDEAGTKVLFQYDTLKRASSETKEGASGSAAIVTAYALNAQHEITSITKTAGALSLSTNRTFDVAGRLTQTVGGAGLTNRLAYGFGGQVVTNTAPDGTTEIVERYLDRRLKAKTGTGVVNEFHSWSIENNTTDATWLNVKLLDSIRYGSTNSARFKSEGTDWHGRVIRREMPDWSTNSPIIEYHSYIGFMHSAPSYIHRSTRSDSTRTLSSGLRNPPGL